MVDVFQVDRNVIGPIGPALDVLREACASVGVDFFVIGAAARDLLLEHVYGVRLLRATNDVDVAVAVQGWDEYEEVLDTLVEDHDFARGREPHRVHRRDLVIDVVPFGDVASNAGRVEWPQGTTAMSVQGYREAYEAAVGIVVDGAPAVPVASLPGLGVLKLIAWSDAPHNRPQDPNDLCTIMLNYQDVVGDRLFNEHADLLEAGDFDVRVASARIYGRDMAPLLRSATLRKRILDVLEHNTEDDDDSKLARAMGSECHYDYAFRLRCLRALRQGILDRV